MEKGYGEGIWRRDMEKGYGEGDMEKGYGEADMEKRIWRRGEETNEFRISNPEFRIPN